MKKIVLTVIAAVFMVSSMAATGFARVQELCIFCNDCYRSCSCCDKVQYESGCMVVMGCDCQFPTKPVITLFEDIDCVSVTMDQFKKMKKN